MKKHSFFLNLAPLNCRRDIAVLGLIHRTVLGDGPEHFREWFFLSTELAVYPTRLQERKHSKQLYTYSGGKQTELLSRSLLGQTRVYNNLLQTEVDASTVKLFQRKLQWRLKEEARKQLQEPLVYFTRFARKPWQLTFSVRKGN